jgi:hypothetical protein
VLALAAFLVDRRNKAVDRSCLGSSNFHERRPECVLNGYAGSIPVALDAPSRDRSPVSGSGHRRLFPCPIDTALGTAPPIRPPTWSGVFIPAKVSIWAEPASTHLRGLRVRVCGS